MTCNIFGIYIFHSECTFFPNSQLPSRRSIMAEQEHVSEDKGTRSFVFHEIGTLPKFAWCVQIDKNHPEVHVFHGPSVEVDESCFVEGAWDSSFQSMEFDRSFLFMGSGGKIEGDKLLFAAPCHTFELLYSVALKTQVFVSNSLAFLLVRTALDLDPSYRKYLLDHKTIMFGFKDYVKAIPTIQGYPARRHYYCNIEVDPELGIRELPKAEPPDFIDFNSYRDFLIKSMSDISRNAMSEDRKITYKLLATLSTGLDSPASTVIAVEAGCREAVTFRDTSWGGDTFDSGIRIAEVLGLTIREFGIREYMSLDGIHEPEFIASGDAGDVHFRTMEEIFRNRLVVMGHIGDTIWDPYAKRITSHMWRRDASGSSLAEFRMRAGFIHAPVPTFGCIRHPSIHKITMSSEMDPWRIENYYDRPIPRRIVEEKGVDRNLFGQCKKATAVWWDSLPPKRESQESYAQFRQKYKTIRRSLYEKIHQMLYTMHRSWKKTGVRYTRVMRRIGLNHEIPSPFSRSFTEPADQDLLFQWGVSMTRDRYTFDDRM
ncbi:MAG: hypothetical protein JSV33_14415 [bacterium]|nr:MAG: hypothetical protein JSV33_14415 [bacterium]